jgi:hypothetical protein
MLAPGLCFLVALFITSVCRLQVREISEIFRAPGSPLASDQVIAPDDGHRESPHLNGQPARPRLLEGDAANGRE